MNRAIQENLKPNKIQHDDGLIEIQFDQKADIRGNFESAIKAWRIMEPTMIKVMNVGLNDENVEKLCEFLSNRNLI